jgi:signal transduction histidine kinase
VRPTSLASRFLVTLVVTCVVPLLLFGWFVLHGVHGLIDAQIVETFLPRLATDHAQKIDSRLQQIFQACSVVREIARRALDSEGELAAFEEQIELVPDLLDNHLDLLLLADPSGRVAWWQDGQLLDRQTHNRRAALIPDSVADTGWFQRAQHQGGAFFLPWGRSPYMHRGLDFRSRDPGDYHLGLAIDVPRPQGPPGALLALIRWPEVQSILDDTRAVLRDEAGFAAAEVFLVAPNGEIHGSTDRARYGELLTPDSLRAGVLGEAVGTVAFRDAAGERCIAGFARCGEGEHRTWTLGLELPEKELFAIRDRWQRALLLAIATTVLVLLVWSLLASRAIARPVHDLVAATARVARGDLAVRVPAAGGRELGELAASFNQMAAELAVGREKLAHAERDKAWAEMARQVAHEIKNPLTPMRMAAQLLLKARRDQDPRADAIAERLANTVLQQTEELGRIAADFQQFAGSPERARQPVRLDELLAEVRTACAALFEGSVLRLELLPGAPAALVAVDRRELGRVFVNLVQNAVQAAPGGVRVTLTSVCDDGTATVRVADDGPGIPGEVQARLFEPYFTTKTAGTGLGLAICRRIVEAHGGTVRLETTGSGGSVFAVTLPCNHGEPAAG